MILDLCARLVALLLRPWVLIGLVASRERASFHPWVGRWKGSAPDKSTIHWRGNESVVSSSMLFPGAVCMKGIGSVLGGRKIVYVRKIFVSCLKLNFNSLVISHVLIIISGKDLISLSSCSGCALHLLECF